MYQLVRSNIECIVKSHYIFYRLFLLNLIKAQTIICKIDFLMGTVKLTSSSLIWRTCVKVKWSASLYRLQNPSSCERQKSTRPLVKGYTKVKRKKEKKITKIQLNKPVLYKV